MRRRKDGTHWKVRMNADEVKFALVQALQLLGIKARTELRIRGIYGVFPADVAVLNDAQQLVTVAEAKVRAHDLGIQQRTNYATCGVPAFLCWWSNVQEIADAMAAYVLRGEQPPSRLLIDERTWASNRPKNGRVQKAQLKNRMVRG